MKTVSQNSKPKIDAIYPLSTIQQGILFHHLTSEDDQGLLHVQSLLEGNLNLENLENAWNTVGFRHEALRTSVHWKNLEKPILVVRPKKEIAYTVYDYSNSEDPKSKIDEFIRTGREQGIDLEKNPSSQINIIKIGKNEHVLIWKCHHLLLDGWSAAIILKDVFNCYDALCSNKEVVFETDPPPYKNYLNWKQRKDKNEAELFWKSTFKNLSGATLFRQDGREKGEIIKTNSKLGEEYFTKLKQVAGEYHITLNTLFQGVWSLLLAKYFKSTQVTFGNTVSGRSGNFPEIESMAGMFINMLPVKIDVDVEVPIQEWFRNIQTQQQRTRNFEDTTNEEISEWVTKSSAPLFDSLFVFENFPWKDIKSGEITVKQFKSGITSNYPLTFIVRIEEGLYFDILGDSNILGEYTPSWLLKNLKIIIDHIIKSKDISLSGILENLTDAPVIAIGPNINKDKNQQTKYQKPNNITELELVKIWESLFDKNPIGIHDNFFALGGKSLMAVKMFSLIRKTLNISLPPITLADNPTIHEMANNINQDRSVASLDYLVPIRSQGTKAPLFCIHSGGGHVFFYRLLSKYLKPNRPIYGINPTGLYRNEKMHHSIEDMAKDYLKAIKSVQPNGPYNILVHCFSTSVGHEMAIQLSNSGEKINIIVADNMASPWNATAKKVMKTRMLFFIKRFFLSPISTIKQFFMGRKHIADALIVRFFGKDYKKELERLKANLRRMSIAYSDWDKKHQGSISLLLTDKPDQNFQNLIINSWKDLAQGGVRVYPTKGQHDTLFEEPYVAYTAENIDESIIE